jgi:hypothetical protein
VDRSVLPLGAPRVERADAIRNRLHLAVQLTAALDGPLLLYLSASDLTEAALQIEERVAQGCQDLVQRVCRS